MKNCVEFLKEPPCQNCLLVSRSFFLFDSPMAMLDNYGKIKIIDNRNEITFTDTYN